MAAFGLDKGRVGSGPELSKLESLSDLDLLGRLLQKESVRMVMEQMIDAIDPKQREKTQNNSIGYDRTDTIKIEMKFRGLVDELVGKKRGTKIDTGVLNDYLAYMLKIRQEHPGKKIDA